MKSFKYLFSFLSVFLIFTHANAAVNVNWQYTGGGTLSAEHARTVVRLANGDSVYAGSVDTSPQMYDYFIAKIDSNQNQIWKYAYGGSKDDKLTHMIQTADGGFLLAGWSISGVSGNKSEPSSQLGDYWLVKVDANGFFQWDETIGGTDWDWLSAVRQTADGGFVLAGASNSEIGGDKSQSNRGPDPMTNNITEDIWVVKLNPNRTIDWQQTIGGSGNDYLNNQSMIATSDGGLLIAATSNSNISGEKAANSRGFQDYWLVKLDSAGQIAWQKTYGGSFYDYAYGVVEDRNGGYLITGASNSSISGDKTVGFLGGQSDFWIVKVDTNGALLWQKGFGGSGSETPWWVEQTLDDGFIVAGSSSSGISGSKTEANIGAHDGWLLKLDSRGNEQWQKTIGTTGVDHMNSVDASLAGSYLFAGSQSIGSTTRSWLAEVSESPVVGLSAFHFEDPYGRQATEFPCAGWDIWLNGTASQNEARFFIDAWRRPIGSTSAFVWQAQIGWTVGQAGRVNLTERFAQLPNNQSYYFQPGYEYQIKLAIENLPHFLWIETVHTFVIPSQLSQCSAPIDNDHGPVLGG